jgi:hypothetical protein
MPRSWTHVHGLRDDAVLEHGLVKIKHVVVNDVSPALARSMMPWAKSASLLYAV